MNWVNIAGKHAIWLNAAALLLAVAVIAWDMRKKG